MRRMWTVLVVGGLGLIAACSQPRIDTSSDERLRESAQRVRATLPPNKQDEFDQAVTTIMASSLIPAAFDVSRPGKVEETVADARRKLHGMTAQAVFAEAERIRERYAAQDREAELQELQTLRQRREQAKAHETALKGFVVSGVRFYKERDYFGTPEPRIRLTFTNNTGSPISRAYFKGVLMSPGRAVPWLTQDFNYSIPGGLEHGESKTVTLAPNQFSEWGTIDAPRDAVLQVTTIKLDGADGETLFDADFSEEDEKRLAELVRRHGAR